MGLQEITLSDSQTLLLQGAREKHERSAVMQYATDWAQREQRKAGAEIQRFLQAFGVAKQGINSVSDLEHIAVIIDPVNQGRSGVTYRTGEHRIPRLKTTPGDPELLQIGEGDIVAAYNLDDPVQAGIRAMVATEGHSPFTEGNTRIGYTLLAGRFSKGNILVPKTTFAYIHANIDPVRDEWNLTASAPAGIEEKKLIQRVREDITRAEHRLLAAIGIIPAYQITVKSPRHSVLGVMPEGVVILDSNKIDDTEIVHVTYKGDMKRLESQLHARVPAKVVVRPYHID